MKTSVQMLDAMKLRVGVQSDYALAKHLGFTKSFLSSVRAGKAGFGDENGLIVAKVLNEPPEYVLAILHAERSKGNLSMKVWESIAAKFARTVCVTMLAFWAMMPADNSYATERSTILHNADSRHKNGLSINYTQNKAGENCCGACKMCAASMTQAVQVMTIFLMFNFNNKRHQIDTNK